MRQIAFVFLTAYAIALCAVPLAAAQTGRLMGKVLDASGNAMMGVTLYISGTAATQAALSNAQGYYTFLNLPEGQYTMRVSKRGVAAWDTKLNVNANLTTRLDVRLDAVSEGGAVAVSQGDTKLLTDRKRDTVADSESKPVSSRASAANAGAVEALKSASMKTDLDDALLKFSEEHAVDDAVAGFDREVEIAGGATAVMEKIKYPELAMKSRVAGKVVARVVVDKAGSVVTVNFLKSVNPMLDQEVFRVLTEETTFIPASAGGKNVTGVIVIPVTFKAN